MQVCNKLYFSSKALIFCVNFFQKSGNGYPTATDRCPGCVLVFAICLWTLYSFKGQLHDMVFWLDRTFFWRATECWPLLCLCRPFCIFDVWIRTRELPQQACRRATNLATHLPNQPPVSLISHSPPSLSHPSPCLATHIPNQPHISYQSYLGYRERI